MAGLILRGLEDERVARLEARAAVHGRSAEAEHREILSQAPGDASARMPYDNLAGKTWIAPDFDETPDDIIEVMETDIE